MVCAVTLFGHTNKQRIREENKKALIFLFFSPSQMKGRWSGSIFAEA